MSFKVKAIYEYNSGHEDDLPFSVGQIITVTEEEDADWYGGEYVDDAGTKQEGIFPRNFVEKYEPQAPPRPTRTRTKKETEAAGASEPAAAAAPLSPTSPKQFAPPPEPEPEPVKVTSPSRTTSAAPALPVSAPEASVPKPAQPGRSSAPPPPLPQPAEAPSVSSPPPPPKAAPTQPKPSGGPPPPVSEKPSSFRDRIAAFNKAAAPPIAPFKPSGLAAGSAGFVKKPFVAPPPSRNAYIPPPQQAPTAKVYRRDEDPEIKEQEAEAIENAGKAGLVPAAAPTNTGDGAEEDQPKPMSLKERLALLQKQQMETAARHADASAKKEKPKRPPKKRVDNQDPAAEEGQPAAPPPPLERRDTEETGGKKSMDETHPSRVAHPQRRKSSRGAEPHDGNEADMSGAGETTEGQEDDLTEREDSDEKSKHVATAAKQDDEDQDEEEVVDEEDEFDEVDEETRRKEELRARMAKMSGGMMMPGMFGMPMVGGPAPPKKKKSVSERRSEEAEPPVSPTARAPPVPTMMALPGFSRAPQEPEQPEQDEAEEESQSRTPHQEAVPSLPSREPGAPPPVPAGRPAPPPIPAESRPPPLPPSASAIKSPSEGSESDDELSEHTPHEEAEPSRSEPAARAPPPPPPTSPRAAQTKRQSFMEESSPISPTGAAPPPPNKRDSRLPPPIPGFAPALPPLQSRPPPPPPPSSAPPSRSGTGGAHTGGDDEAEEEEEEVTEYEGDYDTDIASSVPHKDALKSHQRESSFEETTSLKSPTADAPPPPPSVAAPRGPPPIPTQPPPNNRKSVDMPRAAPPPPPPAKETSQYDDDEYDPYNYGAPSQSGPAVPAVPAMHSYPLPPPPPHMKRPSQETYTPESPSYAPPPQNPPRAPPAPPPASSSRAPPRQSLDVQRPGASNRRSVDVTRPSMDSTGFVANDIDLASQSGWWLQPNSLPPQLQGRKDIFFEAEESSAADSRRGGKMTVTRDIYVLFQDYSQTVITVRFDPQDASDVHIEQRHEAPPRQLRQDQLEQSYERFGRAIGQAVASKKDTVVGDGTPQALIFELLKPFKDALLPVGTRAYGALVYSNLANASTTQNDEIRPGDIISIRNAKFQGKHGPMHAKYSMEVGKPDHVAVVAEWDGTKKKVRAFEQGRESRKVKMESFKLDDLRSGEVKIWRVMPRSWIGWEGGN
ncbi:hypothetical protein QBC46DRAFT_262302 [Diplogelasinospora grovesii]|uniref:SH3 domain-containing protein n=1 Tax=Diplogelasinospora grovesii TaxID=303347 RepID=A0AAN6S3L0_9PEZI|nr:hypothetical protein QBC46DRAFT_262302 [Diplogelasinospora grovesii]